MTNTSIISALAAAAMFAGCTASTPTGNAQSTGQSALALAVITKDPAAVADSTVTVPIKRELTFTIAEADAAKWTGTVADPAVAEFVPAQDSKPAGIHPLAEGETTVELTAPDGATISFTLVITPGAR